jgi:hypothetical protein
VWGVFTGIYIYLCGLFNDTISSSDNIALDDRMINELERIRKEVVMA